MIFCFYPFTLIEINVKLNPFSSKRIKLVSEKKIVCTPSILARLLLPIAKDRPFIVLKHHVIIFII